MLDWLRKGHSQPEGGDAVKRKLFVLGTAIGLMALVAVAALACGGEEEQETPYVPFEQRYLAEIRDGGYSATDAWYAYHLITDYSYEEDLVPLGVDDEELAKIQELARVYAINHAEGELADFREEGTLREQRRAAERFFEYIEFLGVDASAFGVTPKGEAEIRGAIVHEKAHRIASDLKYQKIKCQDFQEEANGLRDILGEHPILHEHFEDSDAEVLNHATESYFTNKQALLCGISPPNSTLVY